MIDGVKLKTQLTGEQSDSLCNFLSDQGEDYKETFTKAGEGEKKKSCAKYKGLKVTIIHNADTTSTVIINGSLHKYSNGGKHNHNEFLYQRLIEVIDELEYTLNINPHRTYIQNLEVGIGFTPPIDTPLVLHALLVHAPRGPMAEFIQRRMSRASNYWFAEHSNYFLKVYDKRLQYDLQENKLRFEVKYMKATCFKATGIKTLHDLRNTDRLEILKQYLIKRWEEVIFYDPTLREDELTDKQKERFLHWNNKSYWIKLREKNTSTNKNHVNLEKARFYRIINNHSDKIQEKITILLAEKLRNFDRLSKQYPSDINRNFNTLCIESTILKRPEPSFVCSVTGIDISDQRSGSRFVSEAKVRSIHHSDKQKFYELAFEFGPQDSHDLTLDKLGYFIAHNVRNRDSNQRQRIQRSNMRYKHTLFDINQFLVSQN